MLVRKQRSSWSKVSAWGLSLALTVPWMLVGCGGGGIVAPLFGDAGPSYPFATLGAVQEAITAAIESPLSENRLDTDGDSIPDVVEVRLGTLPDNPDSDEDGLVDAVELFVAGFLPWTPLPDVDGDGEIAPTDADDDGDNTNDGLAVDTDGDGVPNYLEHHGYTFDFLTGRFEVWNGNPDIQYFRTDPLQPSTDQDAYPDGMEVSGALSDPTVRAPGNDPLVPAYPNLVCELVTYMVTLNEEIQITETESLSNGQSWSSDTEESTSHGVHNTWEIGAQYAWTTEGGFTLSGKYGQTYDDTNSTTVTVSTGGSITNEESWSKARSMNPTQAAKLKLYVRLHNRGTAPASNIVPTLALKIGGLNVATFEPAGANVNLLVPGAKYPAQPGWLWVIDSRNTGGGSEPLYLNMSELRALESGAPISLTVTQAQGQAMRLNGSGAWESMGATNEFTARCDAVCANLRIELKDGTLVHQLVYAGEGPSAPPMTLEAALGKLGVVKGTLHYADRDGTPKTQSLAGFHMVIDAATLRANRFAMAADDPSDTATTTPPSDFVLPELLLLPGSSVYVRAPQETESPPPPTVHFATLDPDTGEINVSAADYEGIGRVVVSNQYPLTDALTYREQTLVESTSGAGFFTGNARLPMPNGFKAGELLTARVESLRNPVQVVTRPLGTLFKARGPQLPKITDVSVDLFALRLYATIESGNPDNPNSNIQWMQAFHPYFEGGVAPFTRVIDYYLFPDKYEVELPIAFRQGSTEDIQVVAYVKQGVVTVESTPAVVAVWNSQVMTLAPTAEGNNFSSTPETRLSWVIEKVDLDAARPSTGRTTTRVPYPDDVFPLAPPIAGPPQDLVLTFRDSHDNTWAMMNFNCEYKVHTATGRTAFDALAREEILTKDSLITQKLALRLGDSASGGIVAGKILLVRTTDGRVAKVFVESVAYDQNWWAARRWALVKLRWVTYDAFFPVN